MTGTRAQFLVDQAGFGWSHDRPGVQMLGYSFASVSEAQKWKIRLIDHVRILPTGNAPGPDTAWSYFQFGDGTAALLYRMATSAHSSGRNDSRALIGPSSSLTVSVALGFALGDHLTWSEQSVHKGAQLVVDPEACVISHDIREYAQAWWSGLASVLARMLEEPGRPVSVIGCPDKYRLMMITVLRAIVEDQRLEHSGHLLFDSFSTYEDTHDTSVVDLPDLVFLSKRPSGSGVVERVVIDLERDTGEGPNLDEASRILDRFIKQQPAPRLTTATTNKPNVEAPRGNYSRRISERVESARSNGHGSPAGGKRVTTQPGRRRPENSPRYTLALLNAESLETFTAELGKLRSLCQSKQTRQDVQRELDVRALDSLASLVENDIVRQLDSQVLDIVYGTSLSDVEDGTALQHAAEYVKRGKSEQLTRLLGRAMEKRSRNEALSAVFERWVSEDPFVTMPRRRRISPLVQRAKRVRYLSLILAIAVVALLGAVFLLGVIVGGSAVTQQTAVSEAIPSAVPVAVPVPPAQVPGLTGQATVHAGIPRSVEGGLELDDA